MNYTFPPQNIGGRVVEVSAHNGEIIVFVWQNERRDDGMMIPVADLPTARRAIDVIRKIVADQR